MIIIPYDRKALISSIMVSLCECEDLSRNFPYPHLWKDHLVNLVKMLLQESANHCVS